MRFLTFHQFEKLNFQIPNIERLGPWTIRYVPETGYYYYEYDSVAKIIFKVVHDTWYNKLTLTNMDWDTEFFIEHGYIDGPVRGGMTILDSLYQHANPIKYHFSTLNLERRKLRIKKIIIRCNKYENSNNSYTNKLIKEVFETIDTENRLVRPDNTCKDLITIIKYVNKAKQILKDTLDIYTTSLFNFDIRDFKWKATQQLNKANLVFINENNIQEYSHFYYNVYPVVNITALREWFKDNFNIMYDSTQYCYYDYTQYTFIERTLYRNDSLTFTTCPFCGTSIIDSQLIEGVGCTHCTEKYKKIHQYSTRVPDLLKFKVNKVKPKEEPLYLGLELEYESKRDKDTDTIVTNRVLEGHAILKSDGSISNGFEIVTCPATIDIHLEEFKYFFDVKPIKTSLKGEENTGMHIHISRKALGNFTIGKMIAFFNHPSNKTKLEKIGKRKLNHYCNQDSNRTFTYELTTAKGRSARYNILNTCNEATVEIRMFATPETYEEFATNLEFAHAISKYCSPANSNLPLKQLIEFDNFKFYALSNKKDYPNLTQVLKGL